MIRHVLAHNGSREQAIVDHAATLVRLGGAVYLADIDAPALRLRPADGDFTDLNSRYEHWHAQRGNDLSVGAPPRRLLAAAGLADGQHHARYQIFPIRADFRPPRWAARDALVAAGLATQADIDRWEAAFRRVDEQHPRPTVSSRCSSPSAGGRRMNANPPVRDVAVLSSASSSGGTAPRWSATLRRAATGCSGRSGRRPRSSRFSGQVPVPKE